MNFFEISSKTTEPLVLKADMASFHKNILCVMKEGRRMKNGGKISHKMRDGLYTSIEKFALLNDRLVMLSSTFQIAHHSSRAS